MKLSQLVIADREALLARAAERRRVNALPAEVQEVERRRAQLEWQEYKRQQKAEANRQREMFADLRELSGRPRELPPRFL